MKSLPIYLFKSRWKWSSFKIISIYYFWFQPKLLGGLIICLAVVSKQRPGRHKAEVMGDSSWKVAIQSLSINNRHEDAITCQIPAHSIDGRLCAGVDYTRGSLSLSSKSLCCPELLALPQQPPCGWLCTVYLRYNLYTCKLVGY